MQLTSSLEDDISVFGDNSHKSTPDFSAGGVSYRSGQKVNEIELIGKQSLIIRALQLYCYLASYESHLYKAEIFLPLLRKINSLRHIIFPISFSPTLDYIVQV